MLDVLFVDDEHSVLEALRDALRSQRYAWRMRFAAGGRDALALLDQHPPRCDRHRPAHARH
jgi:DNA-binding NtrC family response regulator